MNCSTQSMKRKFEHDNDVPQYVNAKRSMHSSNCQLQYVNPIPSPPQEDLMMIDEPMSDDEVVLPPNFDYFVFSKDDADDSGYTGQLERGGWSDMYYDMFYQS